MQSELFVLGRPRKGPALWEDRLMRNHSYLLRSVRQGRLGWRQILGSARSRGFPGAWQLAIKMMCGRFGPSTWQTASQTGRSFTVIRSNSVCFELTSGLGT